VQVLYRRGHEEHTGHAVGGGPVERLVTIYMVVEEFACGMRRAKKSMGAGFGSWDYFPDAKCSNAQDVVLKQKENEA
jgi:hypothetical protein